MKMYNNSYKILLIRHTINSVYHCKNENIHEDMMIPTKFPCGIIPDIKF